jgi:glyoxylase I family protein
VNSRTDGAVPRSTNDPKELNDHVAFGVADRDELAKWATRLDELGIVHGGIKDRAYGSGISFRDPDGIALELFAPPA